MSTQARLSHRIVQDVVDTLDAGCELPFRLNALGIAQHYGISRTPVHEAIQELQRLGKLVKMPNGRLGSVASVEQTPLSMRANPLGSTSIGDRQFAKANGEKSNGDRQLGSGNDPTANTELRLHHADPRQDSRVEASNDNEAACDLSVPKFHESKAGASVSSPTSSDSVSTLSANWAQFDGRDAIRRNLAQTIVRLSLRGQTTFLREQSWSRQLGIGRGVFRQMLSELAGQGFVEHVPRRGWQVRPFDTEAMLQYLEIREVLELHALELAKDRLDPERLREMLAGNPTDEQHSAPIASPAFHNVALVDPVDADLKTHPELTVPTPKVSVHSAKVSVPNAAVPVPTRVTETLNNEIHGYLIALSDNRYILDFFARHSTYYDQLFEMATVETGWRAAMAQQHREILTTLLSKDWHRSKQALANHIRAQRPVVQTLLSKIRDES